MLLITAFSSLMAVVPTSMPATRPTTAAGAAATVPTVIVAVGAAGEPAFGKQFNEWADRWMAASQKRSARAVLIGREGSGESPADRDRLKTLLDEEPKEGTGPLWIVLIGHGTYDSKEAKFNLRGTDVTDVELAEWLKPFNRPLAIINCSSSSAPFLNKLSAKNRVVITATRSGSEINFSRFGDYLSTSIADPSADLDKDGQTSLLEAFLAASHRTNEFYKQETRIATEHALLDDNGDGLGIGEDWFEGLRATRSARDGAPLDGPRAQQWTLVLSATEQAMPVELRTTRDAIEMKIEALRAKKKSLPEADYYRQLDSMMLELARLYDNAAKSQRP